MLFTVTIIDDGGGANFLPNPSKSHRQSVYQTNENFVITTEAGVYNLLQELNVNKSCGPDGVTGHVLKTFSPIIISLIILTELFSYSLKNPISNIISTTAITHRVLITLCSQFSSVATYNSKCVGTPVVAKNCEDYSLFSMVVTNKLDLLPTTVKSYAMKRHGMRGFSQFFDFLTR